MAVKQALYIFCFSVLGGMLGFLLHAFIEVPILYMLIQSPTGAYLGITYDAWSVVHMIGTPLLLLLGIAIGFSQGKFWWQKLYVETHHRW
jgi:hypothetical protein